MSDRIVAFSELAGNNLLEIGAGRPRSVGLDRFPLPILRVADVLEGRINPSFQNNTPVTHSREMGPKTSKPGDVVLTAKGTVGRVAMMPSEGPTFAYSPQLCYFRPIAKGPLRPRYLYYWFKSEEFWNQADALKGQTDMADFLSLSDVHSLKMRIPSLQEQVSVIDLLGSLDDKIAANERILHLCTELSDTKFTRAVNGIQPGSKTFGDIAEVNGGGTPNTSIDEYWNGDISWATPTDVTGLAGPYLFSTSRMITQAGLDSCNSALYPQGSILMTSRATIGAFAIAQSPVAVNQGFIVVNAKDPRYQLWLFHEMRARVAEFVSHANGATFLEFSRGKFKQFRVRIPEAELAHIFSQEVGPLHALASQTISESEDIASVRDELLPLLMSGKVRVKDAEKVVEEVV